MGMISGYLADKLVKHVANIAPYTKPSLYMALCTSVSVSYTECAGANYARVSVPNWLAAGDTVLGVESRFTSNVGVIQFATAGFGGWTTPGYWVLFDTSTPGTGNIIAYGSIYPSSPVNEGDAPSFDEGEIQVSYDNADNGWGWSTPLIQKVLDHVFEGTSYTAPTTLYMGFSTDVLSGTSGVTNECASIGGYARQEVGNIESDGTLGELWNTELINFPVTGSWTPGVQTIFVSDHATDATAGHLMFYCTIDAMDIMNGDVVDVPINNMYIYME